MLVLFILVYLLLPDITTLMGHTFHLKYLMKIYTVLEIMKKYLMEFLDSIRKNLWKKPQINTPEKKLRGIQKILLKDSRKEALNKSGKIMKEKHLILEKSAEKIIQNLCWNHTSE